MWVISRLLLPYPSSLHYFLSASLSNPKHDFPWLFCLLSSHGGSTQEFMAISPHFYIQCLRSPFIAFISKNSFISTPSGEWDMCIYSLTPILHWDKLSSVDLTPPFHLGCYCIWAEWHSSAPRKEKLGG